MTAAGLALDPELLDPYGGEPEGLAGSCSRAAGPAWVASATCARAAAPARQRAVMAGEVPLTWPEDRLHAFANTCSHRGHELCRTGPAASVCRWCARTTPGPTTWPAPCWPRTALVTRQTSSRRSTVWSSSAYGCGKAGCSATRRDPWAPSGSDSRSTSGASQRWSLRTRRKISCSATGTLTRWLRIGRWWPRTITSATTAR